MTHRLAENCEELAISRFRAPIVVRTRRVAFAPVFFTPPGLHVFLAAVLMGFLFLPTHAQAAPLVSLSVIDNGATVEAYHETVKPLNETTPDGAAVWVESDSSPDPAQGTPSTGQAQPLPRPQGLDHLAAPAAGVPQSVTQTTVDEILDQEAPGRAIRITLNPGNQGTRGHTFSVPGRVTVKAYLTTYGPASLKVVIRKASGTEIEWMRWSRADDSDPGPLFVDGVRNTSSMYAPRPGDFTARPVSLSRTVGAGDRVELTLRGDFGSAPAALELMGRDR